MTSMLRCILMTLSLALQASFLHGDPVSLLSEGWRPIVREQLEHILNHGAGKHLPVVFDLDETILARDIADATLAVLVRDSILDKNKIPEYLTPSFQLGDTWVSLEQAIDLVEYASWIQQSTKHQLNDQSSNMCFYCWTAQVMAGLTCLEVIESAKKAYNAGKAQQDIGQYPGETKIWATPNQTYCLMPFVRPEMVELLAAFLQNDYEVWIVSASPVHIARWIVLNEINKLINEFGIKKQITGDHVIGISTLMQRKEDGLLFKDYPLVCDDINYRNLDPTELKRYVLTGILTPPITGYSGKVAAILDRIGSCPYFGAGDSLSDLPFLKSCEHKLWIGRLESPELQKAAMAQISNCQKDDSWLIQPVLSKKSPCFLPYSELLPQLLKNPDELYKASQSLQTLGL